MGKYNLNAQTAFWQIRPDESVFLKQDIKNAMELPVDFRVELNTQNLFAVLHHVDGAVLRPSGDGKPGRNIRHGISVERTAVDHILPGKTVEFMEDAGARYYNEAILVSPVGSLPIRVGKQFTASRKLGKTHQNVLTFCKGDAKKAVQRLGDVFIPDLLEDE